MIAFTICDSGCDHPDPLLCIGADEGSYDGCECICHDAYYVITEENNVTKKT